MKNTKLKASLFIILISCLVMNVSSGQAFKSANSDQVKSGFTWPEGKVMAMSLTFDDGRACHVEKAMPVLEKYGTTGTFYVTPRSIGPRLDAWKNAVKTGHDIGNHSLLHTCSVNHGSGKGGGLEGYTLTRMKMELDSAAKVLKSMLGKDLVSFGYPCGQTFIGKGIETRSLVPLVAMMFQTGRGWLDEAPNNPLHCDMAQLMGMKMDGLSFEQVKQLIETARKSGKWLILVGHEISDTDRPGLTTLTSTLEEICKYASDPANGIWIDNVNNVATYVKDKRGERSAVR